MTQLLINQSTIEKLAPSIYKYAYLNSKDPNTKVGCIIVSQLNGGYCLGYNKFPTHITDTDYRWQKPIKYQYVIHAEVVAIIEGMRRGIELATSVLYSTHFPCSKCMGLIVEVGIKTVFYTEEHKQDAVTYELAREAHIQLIKIDRQRMCS